MMWVAIGVGALAALFVLGAMLTARDRRQAPRKLELARATFARGESTSALRLLDEAFYEPLGDRYEAKDARVALEVVELADEILRSMGLDPTALTAALKEALRTASERGGDVPEMLRKRLKKFLGKANNDFDLVTAMAAHAAEGESDGLPGPESEEEVAVLNEVGKLILFGKTEKAIAKLDGHLATAEGAFRATLLNQRGGCHAMRGDHARAAADYEECTRIEPGRAMHWTNLAETYGKLGRRSEAAECSRKALSAGA